MQRVLLSFIIQIYIVKYEWVVFYGMLLYVFFLQTIFYLLKFRVH